ncbi:MAG: hypothetical protein HGA78_01155 [Nitrospirales bacterium]|nr:hypothetical protein [Nitrospirales bacterium]
MRLGLTIAKTRHAGIFVNQYDAEFAKDAWAKLTLGVKGIGKYETNTYSETINAAYNAASLTLAANGVQGADATTRLANVQRIRVKVPTTNEWQEVSYSAVSGATPAVITITAPGGVGTLTDYELLYIPTEPAWCTFPVREEEPPLRTSDLTIVLGGKYNGTTVVGGRTLSEEIESITISGTNDMQVEFRPGGTGSYANYARRNGRHQVIKLNRELRDYIIRRMRDSGEYCAVKVRAQGPEFETGKNYYVEGIFPRIGVAKDTISVNGRVLVQAGELEVLQDATYGSAIWKIANLTAAYCA